VRLRGAVELLLRPTAAMLGVAVAALAVADGLAEAAGGSTVPGGPFDELAHLLTTLLIVWLLPRSVGAETGLSGAVGVPPNRRGGLLAGALAGSVLIDLDHLPGLLGAHWLTAGTPRPYTHSLLTISGVLGVAALWRFGRPLALGVAAGLAIHFWRDLAEPGSGVALLWPLSDRAFTLPHAEYVAAMVAVAGVDAWRLRRRPRSPRRSA
jgi:hypothetical protein